MATKTPAAPAPRKRKSPVPAAAAAPAAPTVPAPKPAAAKRVRKPPRPHLVRDSFTMPEADFAFIATLKASALAAGRAAKKSELLRAGLHALSALEAAALVAALDRLAPVKTGRPKKDR